MKKNGLRVTLSLILLTVFLPFNLWAQCEISVDEKSGLFTIRSQSLDLVSTSFAFWGKKWKWAGTKTNIKINGSNNYNLETKVPLLDLAMKAEITAKAENQMSWQYELNSTTHKNGVIGGGITFKINDKSFDHTADVKLLANKKGWVLNNHTECGPIKVQFDKPVKHIYFERGNRHEIRAWFYTNNIKPETNYIRMTVTLPAHGKIAPTLSEKLGQGPDKNWHKDIIHWAYSPVDLSFLNKPEIPAGKHGFMKTKGENLIFEDGTKAKFWGINITAYTLFKTSPSEIKRHARRLSKLGFNLVRIHHHDSKWVSPNIFGNKAKDTLTLDRNSLKILDLWIKTLKEEGIYIWLDLQVGRAFTEHDDIQNFAEIAKGKPSTPAWGFNYINPDIQQRMMEFNEAYLNHINAYTSLAYKDDPAIISVLLTNENDLTHHFGNALLPNNNVPNSNKVYMAKSAMFALEHNLPVNKTWRSWEHGPSKIFLNNLEHQFNQKMIRHLRDLELKIPIATTNSWGAMPLSGLPALTDGNIIDTHSYGRPDIFKSNPRYKNTFLDWIGAAQVNGKPLASTEWNISPFPAFDRYAAPLFMAGTARLQGWDALMQYGYSQAPLNSAGNPSNWHAFNDPASLALMPAAALIYRQGHVAEAQKTYALSLSKKDFFYNHLSPQNSATIRTLLEQSKLVINLPKTKELKWLNPDKLSLGTINVTDHDRDFIPKGQNFVQSDTGELTRNWNEGIYTIDTEKSQIVTGWIGGKEIKLQNIDVAMENKNAAVAVQSLDGKSISNSKEILISLAAQSVTSKGKLPFLSEPMKGVLKISAQQGLSLYGLNSYGKESKIETFYQSGQYLIKLAEVNDAYWMVLK